MKTCIDYLKESTSKFESDYPNWLELLGRIDFNDLSNASESDLAFYHECAKSIIEPNQYLNDGSMMSDSEFAKWEDLCNSEAFESSVCGVLDSKWHPIVRFIAEDGY